MRRNRVSFSDSLDQEQAGYDNPALDSSDAGGTLTASTSDLHDSDGAYPESDQNSVARSRRESIPDLRIERPAFTQELFDESFQTRVRRSKPVRERLMDVCCRVRCSGQCVKKVVLRLLPFLTWLRHYDLKVDLISDIIAGLLVGIMTIPQGMAYGLLTSLPAVYGLYVSFFPVIIYFFLGTSKHISMGTFAVISIMINSALEKSGCESLANEYTMELPTGDYTQNNFTFTNNTTNDTMPLTGEDAVESDAVVMCKVKVATAVTFVTGIIQLFMGICNLGFVTIYLSYPLTRGLTTGASIYVFTSQIRHVFGISLNTYNGPLKLVYTYIDIFKKLPTTNIAALIVAIISLVVMVLVKELANPKVKKAIKMPVPIELTFVIIGTVVSYYWGMNKRFGMDVVGLVPTGIPAPSMPPPRLLAKHAVDGVSIALVSFALNASLVMLFSKKYNYKVNINQELIAYGVANTASSFFNCYVSAASLSRSMVHDGVGGKTQVVGLISSLLILVVLFAIGPLFAQLPKAILATIVIVNLKGMFLQFKDLKVLWAISKYDFMDWLIVFVAVIFLNVDLGLGVGLGFSLLSVIFRTQRPYTFVLGRIPGTDIYKNVDLVPTAKEIPGLKIFRFEASLYFANNEHFTHKLFQKSGVNPRKLFIEREKQEKKLKKQAKNQNQESINKMEVEPVTDEITGITFSELTPPITDIIIDCTTMAYIDFMGVKTLSEVIKEYKKIDINVYLAGCKVGVREMLEAAGFYENIPRDQLFVCVHDAVLVIEEKRSRMLGDMKKSYSTSSFNNTRL